MTHKLVLTADELRKMFRYEPKTGRLFGQHVPPAFFEPLVQHKVFPIGLLADRSVRRYVLYERWLKDYKGRELFLKKGAAGNGALVESILGVPMYAHHVAYALHHGRVLPRVGHLNGDKSDNRADNLIDGTLRRRPGQNNSSGRVGVSKNAAGRWVAQIRHQGHGFYLGTFDTLDAACEARETAEGVVASAADQDADRLRKLFAEAVGPMKPARTPKMSISNSSGRVGVSWSQKMEKWQATIYFDKKQHFLGAFETFEDACAARERGEQMKRDYLESARSAPVT